MIKKIGKIAEALSTNRSGTPISADATVDCVMQVAGFWAAICVKWWRSAGRTMRRAMIDRRGSSDRPTCGACCASNANVRCGGRVGLARLTAHDPRMQ
jgi:hypothetical protein